MTEEELSDLSALINEGNSDNIEDALKCVADHLAHMSRLNQVKKLHPNPIRHTEISGYFTWVYDPEKPKNAENRKIFRSKTEEGLWEALASWYLDNKNKDATLADVFQMWIKDKETPGNKSNIERLIYAWKAYYLNEPLSKDIISKPMNKLKSLELRKWAESILKKNYPVDPQKFSRIFSIMNGCFAYAADEDIAIIAVNIWETAKKKINRELIVRKEIPSDDEQVFTDNERRKIKEIVYEDLEKYSKQSSSAGLQILFLFETGLRIGEACGLKWTDVKNGRLYIRRQADNDGVRDHAKTVSGRRDIPLTDEALRILDDVRSFNEAHGYDKEWIFQSNNPDYDFRLSYNAADRKLRKLCTRLDTPEKSPHKIRKTCLSTLLDSQEVNDRTVQRFAGHKDISTTHSYYDYDRKSKEEQAEAINNALKLE